MNRRNFITSIGALVGGLALDKAIPFNRVWSFPSKIVIPKYTHLTYELGIRVSMELVEDDQYEIIRKVPLALAKSLQENFIFTEQMMYQNLTNMFYSS